MPRDLTPIELFAIRQAGKEAEDFRDDLTDGLQDVDFAVHITGEMSVACDAPKPKQTLKASVLIPLILDGLTSAARAKVLNHVALESADWTKGGDEPKTSLEARNAADKLSAAASRQPSGHNHGAVRGKLEIEVLPKSLLAKH